VEWQIATQTHRGNVRRINEDALLVEKHYPLLMVADGMGGHQAGDVASRMLVETLGDLELNGRLEDVTSQVNRSILQCNNRLREYARRKLDGVTMGSTVVAMLADHSTGICLWAGDSRLYRARGNRLKQLTADHSYVAELVRSGQLLPEEAVNHPSSNIITRAVGSTTDLSLDSRSFDIQLDDTYLLCSDGLYNEVDGEEILTAMRSGDIWQSSHQLLNLCLSRRARDNVSFIIARPMEDDPTDPDATLTFYPAGS
jgi:protein phosphatase